MDSKGKLTGSTSNRDEYGSASDPGEPGEGYIVKCVRACMDV